MPYYSVTAAVASGQGNVAADAVNGWSYRPDTPVDEQHPETVECLVSATSEADARYLLHEAFTAHGVDYVESSVGPNVEEPQDPYHRQANVAGYPFLFVDEDMTHFIKALLAAGISTKYSCQGTDRGGLSTSRAADASA